MTCSPLCTYQRMSPNHSGTRTHKVDTFTPHCVVGQASVERIGEIFAPTSRQASSNYGIGPDGRIGMYVDEDNRSWCTSSRENDQRAITIEVASDSASPYAFTPAAYDSLIKLCVDVCKRYGKKKLVWLGDNKKNASYEPKADEMRLTIHRWYSAKSCPGQWLVDRLPQFTEAVNKQLGSEELFISNKPDSVLYKVQVGAYKVRSNATAMEAKLKREGYSTYMVMEDGLYKVQTGAFKNSKNAQNLSKELKAKGFTSIVKTYKQ